MRTPDGQPLLALDRVGEGRVALLLSDQIWLWSRGHDGGGPQAELLRRIAHWLMKEPALEENALTAHVNEGRLTVLRRSTDPAPPGAGDDHGSGRQGHEGRLDAGRVLGEATISLPATTPGVWQASDGTFTRRTPRRVRPIRRKSPICGRPRRWSANWPTIRAAACTGLARWRRWTCRRCGGPSRIVRRPAAVGSGCSAGTTIS